MQLPRQIICSPPKKLCLKVCVWVNVGLLILSVCVRIIRVKEYKPHTGWWVVRGCLGSVTIWHEWTSERSVVRDWFPFTTQQVELNWDICAGRLSPSRATDFRKKEFCSRREPCDCLVHACSLYTGCGNKVRYRNPPVVFCKFLSNRLEFYDKTLRQYSLLFIMP